MFFSFVILQSKCPLSPGILLVPQHPLLPLLSILLSQMQKHQSTASAIAPSRKFMVVSMKLMAGVMQRDPFWRTYMIGISPLRPTRPCAGIWLRQTLTCTQPGKKFYGVCANGYAADACIFMARRKLAKGETRLYMEILFLFLSLTLRLLSIFTAWTDQESVFRLVLMLLPALRLVLLVRIPTQRMRKMI